MDALVAARLCALGALGDLLQVVNSELATGGLSPAKRGESWCQRETPKLSRWLRAIPILSEGLAYKLSFEQLHWL